MPEKPPIIKFSPTQTTVPDISQEQTILIGRVIINWSRLDAALDDTIWMLLDLDHEDGKTLTKNLHSDRKIQLLRTLGPTKIGDNKALGYFVKVMNLINELKDCRNFVAHGTWFTLLPDNVAYAASLKPKGDPGEIVSESFSPERMVSILDGIENSKAWLIELPEKIGKSRRALQEEYPNEIPSS